VYEHTTNLNAVGEGLFNQAKECGFHSGEPNLANHLMNLNSEISELWEAYRANKLNEPCDKALKMCGWGIEPLTCMEEEMADIIIRALDTAHAFGIDIDKAVRNKAKFNVTRGFRHGGKLA